MANIKVVFMGTPDYAKKILETLWKDREIEVSLVLTQPDKPVGRKRVLTPPPVKVFAQEKGIEVLQPETLKDIEIIKHLKEQKCDFIVVAAYGQLLPKDILDIAPCVNLHASLLPQYRGASPVQQSLLNMDEYSGVTAMLMEEGLDSGPALAYSYIKLDNNMRLHYLMDELTKMAAELTPKVLKKFDKLQPLEQFSAIATHCKKIRRQDGKVDFSSAEEIIRKYRAFEGWPGVFLDNGLKLLELELLESNSENIEGKIINIDEEYMDIACKKGSIRVYSLQPSGKKAMSSKAYLIGRGLKVGDFIL